MNSEALDASYVHKANNQPRTIFRLDAFLLHTYLASRFSVLKNTELYSISIGYRIQYRLFKTFINYETKKILPNNSFTSRRKKERFVSSEKF